MSTCISGLQHFFLQHLLLLLLVSCCFKVPCFKVKLFLCLTCWVGTRPSTLIQELLSIKPMKSCVWGWRKKGIGNGRSRGMS